MATESSLQPSTDSTDKNELQPLTITQTLPTDMICFTPTQYPHWRCSSTVDAKSTSTMLASIRQFTQRYELLSEEQKAIISKRRKDATMAEFVFSVSSIEGEGLDTLCETEEFLKEFIYPSSKNNVKGKLLLINKAGLPSLEATSREALDLTESDSLDHSSKTTSTLNMYKATRIALERSLQSTKPQLDTSFIKSLHEALFGNTGEWFEAGKYRKYSAFTIMSNQDKHTYLSHSKIATEVNRLVERTNLLLAWIFTTRMASEDKVRSLVKLGGTFFMQFESIHPFHDGNGRVGRLLLAYILSSITPFGLNSLYVDREGFPIFVDRSIYLKCCESDTRDPSEITALIIEGIYVGWRIYFLESD